MKMRLMMKALGVAIVFLLLTSCGDSKAREDGKTAGKPPVAVETSPVTTADLKETIEVVGSLAPKFSADVKS